MKTHSRYNVARKILIFWCLFIGIGAVGGAVGMLTAIDGSNLGMQELLPFFQVLPFAKYLFQDFLFPEIALLCVNGIPNLVAAILLFMKKKSGIICGTIFGITLMAWITIQFVIFPSNFLSCSYFVFGVLQMLTGIAAWIFYSQEHFIVDQKQYHNIATDKSRLVVYFSRMGYTKKVAFEEANRTGAELYEIKSPEPTEGTLGFWWCGRFAMHKWDMPIQEIKLRLEDYRQVTICSPIWAFNLAAPVRSFCRAARGKIKKADYILVHFQNIKYRAAAKELDSLLGITADSVTGICTRHGKLVNKVKIKSDY